MSVMQEYEDKAGKLWSGSFYRQYKDVQWGWEHYPFHDDFARQRENPTLAPSSFVNAKSILEVGSAMGQGYFTLRESGVVDVSDYTGYDVSEDGQKFCRENYPDATWVQGNFDLLELGRSFEYSFERHAVHHMPNPLKQFDKILSATERAACFTFRGRITGDTVSDLTRSYYNHTTEQGFSETGRVFLNQINVFDVIDLAVAKGFNHIGIRLGLHEPVQSEDPDRTGYYMTPEVKAAGGELLRFNFLAGRDPGLSKPLFYAYPGQRRIWLLREFYKLRSALAGRSR